MSHAPIRTDAVGYEGGRYADLSRPLYLTDGDASTHEVAGTLSRTTGPVRTYVEIRRGQDPVDPGDWVTRQPGGAGP